MSWVTPVWLVGLALLPAIRWLHRGGRHRRAVQVSRLGLWRGATASPAAAGERRPPDPAWRRRALLTALLFIALAEPQLARQRPDITLWVDDSPSMLTREAQGTRLVDGLAQARSMLAEMSGADVEVRTLSDPWHKLGSLSDVAAATLAAGAGRKLHEPQKAQKPQNPPPAGLLRSDKLHWLLTDGAHANLLAWPGGRRPDRVILVGSVSRNVAVERLSARRNLDQPHEFDLLLKLSNGGDSVETRALALTSEAGELASSSHRIEPGASVLVQVTIAAATQVRATLHPGDALAEDDELALDLAPLRARRVATDPGCPAALVAAVGTHPGLESAAYDATDVAAVLDCGTRRSADKLPTIRVLAQRTPSWPAGAPRWSSRVAPSNRIRLDADQLPVAARLQAGPADTVLLAVGDEPVIVSRAGPAKLLETSLDFAALANPPGPQMPLLVNLMFEQVLGAGLLDGIAIEQRSADAARVVPSQPVAEAAGDGLRPESRFLRDATRPLLALAALVLLWEIGALARQGRRLASPVASRDGRAAGRPGQEAQPLAAASKPVMGPVE